MAKPLSTYVIFAFLISGFELYLCYQAFNNTACVVDMPLTQKTSVDFTTWVIIQGGFGLLNLLFAPYFQRKIWQHLKKELESPESDTSETDTHADGYVVVPKKRCAGGLQAHLLVRLWRSYLLIRLRDIFRLGLHRFDVDGSNWRVPHRTSRRWWLGSLLWEHLVWGCLAVLVRMVLLRMLRKISEGPARSNEGLSGR